MCAALKTAVAASIGALMLACSGTGLPRLSSAVRDLLVQPADGHLRLGLSLSTHEDYPTDEVATRIVDGLSMSSPAGEPIPFDVDRSEYDAVWSNETDVSSLTPTLWISPTEALPPGWSSLQLGTDIEEFVRGPLGTDFHAFENGRWGIRFASEAEPTVSRLRFCTATRPSRIEIAFSHPVGLAAGNTFADVVQVVDADGRPVQCAPVDAGEGSDLWSALCDYPDHLSVTLSGVVDSAGRPVLDLAGKAPVRFSGHISALPGDDTCRVWLQP